jgi:chitodextrinase
MTTRRFSLIVGSAALALVAVLLCSNSASSAGKGDRSAPTVPTNLTLTALTETTASFSWGASTDNSGKLSYRLRITNLQNSAYNSLATIAQTQTTYTVNYLAPNSPYAFAVYAVDDKGNRSADSNVVSASTPADTTPPSTPVVQASVLGPSQVQLTWARSTDNLNYCCTYSLNMNGNPFTGNFYWLTTPPSTLSVLIRHLSPGSTNTFSVTATDGTGNNVATSAGVTVTTPPSSDDIAPTVPTNLHLLRDYGCGEVDLAWTDSSDNSGDVIEYEIYVNGVISPLRAGTADFAFVYATAMGNNTFTVKAVDRSGNTSQASSPLKLLLWPC